MGEVGVGGRRSYRVRSPEVWELVRAGFLAGVPVDQLERVFDVTAAAIRKRATRKGWCKKDVVGDGEGLPRFEPLVPPEAAEAVGGDLPSGAAGLAAAALEGVRAGFVQGRLEEAAKLARTAAVLTRIGEVGRRGVGGGYTLEDVARAALDYEYRNELLGIWDDPNPDPVKVRYWDELKVQEDEARAELREEAEQRDADRRELCRLRALVARAGIDPTADPWPNVARG